MTDESMTRGEIVWPELDDIFKMLEMEVGEEDGFWEEEHLDTWMRIAHLRALAMTASGLELLVCFLEMKSKVSRDYWSAGGPRDADGKLVVRPGEVL